ncbi:unnamed protein product [Rangifer tarandus platyrhynchus]|uniref:Uncharacterized protein n=2 Tax=Rangifer tarandus platyrhynchus TaxID=3082113 RepID=A0ABN8YE78_RANTA|nr:unnamed protein product [Rangifer tarandus platyrhynchus]CAI9700169.1 unnamed protein product [Rangifer tarandus platyrhynchus]
MELEGKKTRPGVDGSVSWTLYGAHLNCANPQVLPRSGLSLPGPGSPPRRAMAESVQFAAVSPGPSKQQHGSARGMLTWTPRAAALGAPAPGALRVSSQCGGAAGNRGSVTLVAPAQLMT